MSVSDVIAIAAVGISLATLTLRHFDRRQDRKDSVIKALQGEKEAVAYQAYLVTVNGWPSRRSDRTDLRNALCLAGVFGSSDRTRALVHQALRKHPQDEIAEVRNVLDHLEEIFDMYDDQDALERGKRRLAGIRRAVAESDGSSRD
ncbi:hypothetical protein AB0H69_04805 [Streptomyces phaeochromogenes]|uniref:hypothetical protein n=1 Tax=Streptomyces phaeochromogenes TaxID=1923 RepID=UPI0033C5C0FA